MEITIFGDPMMGLLYESEPFFRKVESHFLGKVSFNNQMAVLVPNVYNLVNPADLRISKEYALAKYLVQLRNIYNAEEKISGMPIKMTNLELFSPTRTSTLPLNLAYKAVESLNKDKAEEFLYRLRFATVALVKATTKTEELSQIAQEVGISKADFLRAFNSPQTLAALSADLDFFESLGISGLPAYLFNYQGEKRIYQGVLRDKDFFRIIAELTKGEYKPVKPILNLENLKKLIFKRPLICLIELQFAFDLSDKNLLLPYLKELEEENFLQFQTVAGEIFIT